ncbi:hypothetical protein HDV00_000027 [Rhizophlyctis rosea]|nr:hypothetical protein HDV00_000027 [Rhizophlyctis rosea]
MLMRPGVVKEKVKRQKAIQQGPPPSPPREVVPPPPAHDFDFDFTNIGDYLEVQQFLNRFSDVLPGVKEFLPLINAYTMTGKICLAIAHSLLNFLAEAKHPALRDAQELRRDIVWPYAGRIRQQYIQNDEDGIEWDKILRQLEKSKSHRTIDLLQIDAQIIILQCLVWAILDSDKMRDTVERQMRERERLDKDRVEELRSFRKRGSDRKKEYLAQVKELKGAGDVSKDGSANGQSAGASISDTDKQRLDELQGAYEEAKATALKEHNAKIKEFEEREQAPVRVSNLGMDKEGNTYWDFDSDRGKVFCYGVQWWHFNEQNAGETEANWFYFDIADLPRLIGFLKSEGYIPGTAGKENLHDELMTNLCKLLT